MGKQDMCSKYAQDYVETFQEMTEEKARKMWDEEIFGMLVALRTKLTESVTEIFPLMCPNCNSFKITVVLGTNRSLECLSCGSKFRIEDRE